jgi:hypothetical protein
MAVYNDMPRADKARGGLKNGKTVEAEVDEPPMAPNTADINKHLYALFSPEIAQSYPDTWIEIAYSDPVTGDVNKAATFSVFEIKEAADFAKEKSVAGHNVYVGPALRQGERPQGGRARDEHVATSAYAWAEYDGSGDDARIQAILKEHDLRPALVVTTGTVPHPRRHLYFKLDGGAPLEKLKSANTSLMKLLGSDAVHNVGRVMRLAGTISYPSPKKCARGYTNEIVTLHIVPDAPVYHVDRLMGLTGETSGTTSNGFDHSENVPEPMTIC